MEVHHKGGLDKDEDEKQKQSEQPLHEQGLEAYMAGSVDKLAVGLVDEHAVQQPRDFKGVEWAIHAMQQPTDPMDEHTMPQPMDEVKAVAAATTATSQAVPDLLVLDN